jgi:hypothetical protein
VLAAGVSARTAGTPLITGTRLRGGSAGGTRGAASFIAGQVNVAAEAGVSGDLLVRADSSYYNGPVISAAGRAGAFFSVTMRSDPKNRRAIAAIPGGSWVAIRYPNAVYDDQLRMWYSGAEVAEVPCTAFTSKKAHTTTGRMIAGRVRRLNPKAAEGQHVLPGMPDEVTCRCHAVFTSNPRPLLEAGAGHRGHAVFGQIFAGSIDGPLAHLPSPDFSASAAWVVLAAMTQDILRAAGALASPGQIRRSDTGQIRRSDPGQIGWLAGQLRSPDHHPGAVAAEQVAREFDRHAGPGIGGALNQHQRGTLGHAQLGSLPQPGRHWLEALPGPVRPLAVLHLEQFIQRAIERALQQPGEVRRRELGVLDGDRLAVGEPQSPHLDDQVIGRQPECRRGGRAGGPLRRTEHPGSGNHPAAAQLLGEAGQGGEILLQPGGGDEGPAAAPDRLGHQAAPGQFAKRMPERHPADAEPCREILFGRQPVAGHQSADRDLASQPVLDLRVHRRARCAQDLGRRPGAGLEGRLPDARLPDVRLWRHGPSSRAAPSRFRARHRAAG